MGAPLGFGCKGETFSKYLAFAIHSIMWWVAPYDFIWEYLSLTQVWVSEEGFLKTKEMRECTRPYHNFSCLSERETFFLRLLSAADLKRTVAFCEIVISVLRLLPGNPPF